MGLFQISGHDKPSSSIGLLYAFLSHSRPPSFVVVFLRPLFTVCALGLCIIMPVMCSVGCHSPSQKLTGVGVLVGYSSEAKRHTFMLMDGRPMSLQEIVNELATLRGKERSPVSVSISSAVKMKPAMVEAIVQTFEASGIHVESFRVSGNSDF